MFGSPTCIQATAPVHGDPLSRRIKEVAPELNKDDEEDDDDDEEDGAEEGGLRRKMASSTFETKNVKMYDVKSH